MDYLKKSILIISGLIICTSLSFAQKAEKKTKTDKIKKGWNLGALPVVSYNSDLGLQYGALVNLYNYGDGSGYPKYNHSLYFEASWFTKGSGIFRFYYDSEQLIKGIRVSADVSYIPDQTYSFYGFNGYDAVYNHIWEETDNSEYKSRVFYRQKREFFRVKLDFQGSITGKFRWLAGFNLFSIYTNSVDVEHLNKNKKDEDKLPEIPGLYDKYVDWGIINKEQANGGLLTNFKLGIVYDSRDNEPNPMRGIWSEVLLIGAPKPLSNMENGFSKLVITHRQYFTLIEKKLSFAYRLGLQSTIAGTAPYYVEPIMYMSKMNGAYSEGLGGSKTLRGTLRNRVVGDGIVYGNFEFRWKVIKTHWFNQNFYFALSTFFDTGRVIKDFEVEENANKITSFAPDEKSDYFDFGSETFHNSVGAGLHVAMNQNFILAIDYGKALDEQDGNSGFYIGLNFLF
jgi:outer membrane protein assembly factor BamA